MSCNCCASVDLSQCQDGITLNGGLQPGVDYRAVITGKQGVYENTYTAESDGSIIILPADYPSGLFNPYAGPLRLEVYLGADKVDFTLKQTFDCVDISIISGTFENSEIGLEQTV